MQFDKDRANQVRQLADRYTSEGLFRSIAWQLVHQGKLINKGASGFADDAASTPVPEDAIYRIYSMTKPIVSLVALQLVEENRLSLDYPVAAFIPSMARLQVLDQSGIARDLQTPITIGHLLTHTAGFSYDFLPDCAVAAEYRELQICSNLKRSLGDAVQTLATVPLASQPGDAWRYSVATDVLAHVLELACDMSLPEILKQRVFDPLGMIDTAFYVPEHDVSRLLPMYGARDLGEAIVDSTEPNELSLLDVERGYPHRQSSGFYRGGHGLFSTTADYLKFLPVLENGKSIDGNVLLSAPMVEMMWSNRIAESMMPLSIGYSNMNGYGWNLFGRVMLDVGKADRLSVTGEGGWAGAACTYFWVDRANRFSGVVMTQYLGSTTPLGLNMQTAAYQCLVADN